MSGKKEVQMLFLMDKAKANEVKAKAKEAGMSLGAYIRFRLIEHPNDFPEVRKLLRENINELNHIGNNINQIAKNMNSGLYIPEDKDRLFAYMKKICKKMDEVMEKVGNL